MCLLLKTFCPHSLLLILLFVSSFYYYYFLSTLDELILMYLCPLQCATFNASSQIFSPQFISFSLATQGSPLCLQKPLTGQMFSYHSLGSQIFTIYSWMCLCWRRLSVFREFFAPHSTTDQYLVNSLLILLKVCSLDIHTVSQTAIV